MKWSANEKDLIQWAWLAGLMDGEGCFMVAAGKQYKNVKELKPLICIVLSEKDKFVLEEVQAIAGGTIYFRKINTNNPRLVNTNDQYQWYISNPKKCVEFSEKIYPFLVLKKETCSKFLKTVDLVQKKVHHTDFDRVDKMRKAINGGRPGRGVKNEVES
jgi:hypothetical protein